MVGIAGKTKEDIESLMKGLEKASEVKAAVMSFQNCPKGVVPMVVIAARPQSNNETSSFTRLIETACTAAASASGGRFLGFAVDGVSLESMDVRRSNCDFISGVSNHIGTTDPNHNAKSLRYQIVGGSCTGSIGDNDELSSEVAERIRQVVKSLESEFDEEDDDKTALDLENFEETPGEASSDDEATKLIKAVRLVFSSTSVAQLLERVVSASSILEPMSRSAGSESKVRKAQSLLGRWICKVPSSSSGGDKNAENDDGLFIERGTVLTMNVSLGGGADAPMTPCRYRVMGVYVKHYNKWLLVNEKQPWARHLEEDKKKKYRFVARMINKDSTGLGDCDDVDLDGGAAYNTANVLRLENGTAILDVIGKLQFQ